MTRLLRTALAVAALLAIACSAAPQNRTFYLGTGPERCLDADSDCHLAHDCCSNWCVNNVCEYRP